jgi:hypothetical protein
MRTTIVTLSLLVTAASIFSCQSYSNGVPSARRKSETILRLAQEPPEAVGSSERRNALINVAAGGVLVSAAAALGQLYMAEAYTPDGFQRISPVQFIAALGDPNANAGNLARDWGIWRVDPGPRGVFLRDYDAVFSRGKKAPAGWSFDSKDWWLEEHGLIMEAPSFPVPPGRYLVTGWRSVTTRLTIDASGGWKLDGNAKLYDVTHLPCRSARYQPLDTSEVEGGPWTARQADFPVFPGAEMPSVEGCTKQDYAVLFVVGKAV